MFPWFAGIAGLLLPGAGHALAKCRGRAAIYFACILGLFGFGVLYGSRLQFHIGFDDPLAVVRSTAQVVVGAPYFIARLLSLGHHLECSGSDDRYGFSIDSTLLAQHRASQCEPTIARFFDLYAICIVRGTLPQFESNNFQRAPPLGDSNVEHIANCLATASHDKREYPRG